MLGLVEPLTTRQTGTATTRSLGKQEHGAKVFIQQSKASNQDPNVGST